MPPEVGDGIRARNHGLHFEHLLHEAWTPGDERDAGQADAERVAREAGARRFTPVHLHPADPRTYDGVAL